MSRKFSNATASIPSDIRDPITPRKWRAELEKLYDQYDRIEESMSGITWDLAVIEVLRWNKFDLERMLRNEDPIYKREISRDTDFTR